MEDLPYHRDPRIDGPDPKDNPDPRERITPYKPGEREALEAEHAHFANYYRNEP
jgi:hypothetical protein